MNWAAEEFATIDLGDKRLDQRAVLLAERLGQSPSASIPAACDGWHETQGAYRFLKHPNVGWEALLQPHWDCARRRMIARRGGFLGRKHDGEPGAKTIWLGLQEIAVFVEGMRFARPSHDR